MSIGGWIAFVIGRFRAAKPRKPIVPQFCGEYIDQGLLAKLRGDVR